MGCPNIICRGPTSVLACYVCAYCRMNEHSREPGASDVNLCMPNERGIDILVFFRGRILPERLREVVVLGTYCSSKAINTCLDWKSRRLIGTTIPLLQALQEIWAPLLITVSNFVGLERYSSKRMSVTIFVEVHEL